MRILVTGAAGFIGSNLADRLLAGGDVVIGIDNFAPYYSRRVKEHNLSLIEKSSEFIFREADLSSEEQMRPIFREFNPDVIVNIGGWGGVTQSVENARTYVLANTFGVVNLLELCREFGVGKFVQASTSSQYAENPVPWVETMPMDQPRHPYAASNRSAELFAYHYYLNCNIQFTALRFFNVYGPRQRPDMALAVMFRSFMKGEPFPLYQDLDTGRDYTYVKDICRGVRLATRTEVGYELVNLGSSNPTKLGDFLAAAEKAVGGKIEYRRMKDRIGEVSMTYADSSKAKGLLGFEPEYTVERGVREYWEWFREQPVWYQRGEF